MTKNQSETVAKIKSQLASAEAHGLGNYHNNTIAGDDVIIFCALTRGAETREVSLRVSQDGLVSTHIINTFPSKTI